MAPLFGPLANANPYAPAPSSAPAYSVAPAYPAAPVATNGLAPAAFPLARPRGPIRPSPPIQSADSALTGASPVVITGLPATRPDRLFGPFASLGGAGSPGL